MAITAQQVKELRELTGAAVLDCKKALEEYQGDFEKAKAYLNEKGLAKAAKKAGRAANDGVIETYTHPGARVGVMLELNCETDFVAKTDQFKSFARELALHIAFANPLYVSQEHIPTDALDAVRAEFLKDAKAQGKPDNITEKIVEGRLNKYFAEVCLLSQPFVKDDEVTVGSLVTRTIAELGENIQVRRFARFALGEAGAGEAEE
ncbi:MAG: translation elongation factor Ts [Anaerolineae bacterium]|nr:translation elongation factor Ts [Anaerolineae bacterium]